jgi:hypothetical protein
MGIKKSLVSTTASNFGKESKRPKELLCLFEIMLCPSESGPNDSQFFFKKNTPYDDHKHCHSIIREDSAQTG